MVYPLHSELASRGIEPHRQAAIPPPPVPRLGESRANLVEAVRKHGYPEARRYR